MLPGMGLDEGAFTFLMRPDQAFQVVAVADIGKIAAAIFEDPERFSGKVLDIASDAITGEQLGDALIGRIAGNAALDIVKLANELQPFGGDGMRISLV